MPSTINSAKRYRPRVRRGKAWGGRGGMQSPGELWTGGSWVSFGSWRATLPSWRQGSSSTSSTSSVAAATPPVTKYTSRSPRRSLTGCFEGWLETVGCRKRPVKRQRVCPTSAPRPLMNPEHFLLDGESTQSCNYRAACRITCRIWATVFCFYCLHQPSQDLSLKTLLKTHPP